MSKYPVSAPMPYAQLIEAFLGNLDCRMKQSKISLNNKNPLLDLREFRTLTIGGPRQTGKTGSGKDVVLSNKKARLINAHHFDKERNKTIKKRTIEGFDELSVRDVEILVINQDSYPTQCNDPYASLEDVYEHHPEWFHPNFSVIRIL